MRRIFARLPLVLWFAPFWTPDSALAAGAATEPCLSQGSQVLLDQRLDVGGDSQASASLPRAGKSDLLLQVVEMGIDVEASVVAAALRVPLRSDYPLTRQGVQRLVVSADVRDASIVVRSLDHPAHRGTVRVVVTALPEQVLTQDCEQFARELAKADADYAAAQQAARSGSQLTPGENERRSKAIAEAYEAVANSERSRPFPEIRGEAELAVAAIDYYNRSLWDESAAWASRATTSFRRAGQKYLEARALALEAAAWLEHPINSGAFERARVVFRGLAEFHRARGEKYDEALQINIIGVAHFNQAQFEAALPHYTEARKAFMALGESPRAAQALQNIALCEWGLGRIRRALRLFAEALASMDLGWRPTMYLNALNNSGLANNAAGNLDESLRMHDRALQVATKLDNSYWIARSKFGVGVTYYAIGDRALSRQYLLEALKIWTPELDKRGRVQALRALAVIESEAGNFELADQYNGEALKLAVSSPEYDRIHLKIAENALARGDLAYAESIIEPLAGAKPADQSLTQAEAKVLRARLRYLRRAFDDAESDLRSALRTLKEYEALNEEFDARIQLAHVLRAAGRREQASAEIAAALELSEEIRTQTANPEYRASVAAAIRPALDLRLELLRETYEELLSAGNKTAAQQVAIESLLVTDASRARAFQLYLRQHIDPRQDAKLARLLERVGSLLRDLAERRSYLATRENRAGPDHPSAQAIRADIRQLRLSLGLANTEIAARTRAGKTETQSSAASILQRFAADSLTAGIEYWLGANAAHAWVVREGSVVWVKLDSGRKIDAAARRFHASLVGFAKVPLRERIAASEELNRLIVEPLESSLPGVTRLVIVPDGALHFVPFAALRDSRQRNPYLIERVTVAMTTALRHAPDGARKEQRMREGRLLLVADPIYQDSDERRNGRRESPPAVATSHLPVRLRGSVDPANLARLPSTQREADAIRALFTKVPVDDLRGVDATRDAFLNRDLSQYRYLHVAAHGVMDAEIPSMSALILGAFASNGHVEDQEVRVGDLLTRTLDANLVVLSACSTSLGPGFPDEGPLSLRYAVLARGARAVVSSLWSTSDDTNADLMTEMYGRMIGSGERVDTALAGAMRKMLGRTTAADPALWAPYTAYIVEN